MEHANAAYKHDDLSGLKRPELNRLAKKLGLNDLRGKNDSIIDRMVNASETQTCEFDEMGELVAVQAVAKNVRRHPVLGEYVKAVVNPRDSEIKEEFFANNHYQCRIRMGEEVFIPVDFIKFINKSCHSVEHYYDERKYNPETGKYGLHTERKVQDYFATMV